MVLQYLEGTPNNPLSRLLLLKLLTLYQDIDSLHERCNLLSLLEHFTEQTDILVPFLLELYHSEHLILKYHAMLLFSCLDVKAFESCQKHLDEECLHTNIDDFIKIHYIGILKWKHSPAALMNSLTEFTDNQLSLLLTEPTYQNNLLKGFFNNEIEETIFMLLSHVISFLNTRKELQVNLLDFLSVFIEFLGCSEILHTDFLLPVIQDTIKNNSKNCFIIDAALVLVFKLISFPKIISENAVQGIFVETLFSLVMNRSIFRSSVYLISKLSFRLFSQMTPLYRKVLITSLCPSVTSFSLETLSNYFFENYTEANFELESHYQDVISHMPKYLSLHLGMYPKTLTRDSVERPLLDNNRSYLIEKQLQLIENHVDDLKNIPEPQGILLLDWKDPDGISLIRYHSPYLFAMSGETCELVTLKIWILESNLYKKKQMKPIAKYTFKSTPLAKISDLIVLPDGANFGGVSLYLACSDSIIQLKFLKDRVTFEKTLITLESPPCSVAKHLLYVDDLQYLVTISNLNHIYVYDMLSFSSIFHVSFSLVYGVTTCAVYYSKGKLIMGTNFGYLMTFDLTTGTFTTQLLDTRIFSITSVSVIPFNWQYSMEKEIPSKLLDSKYLGGHHPENMKERDGELTFGKLLIGSLSSLYISSIWKLHPEGKFYLEAGFCHETSNEFTTETVSTQDPFLSLMKRLKLSHESSFSSKYIYPRYLRLIGNYLIQVMSDDTIYCFNQLVQHCKILFHGSSLDPRKKILLPFKFIEMTTKPFSRPVILKEKTDNRSIQESLGKDTLELSIARGLDFRLHLKGIHSLIPFQLNLADNASVTFDHLDQEASDTTRNTSNNRLYFGFIIADSHGRICIIK